MSAEDAELEAKIAALSSRINQHKQMAAVTATAPSPNTDYSPSYPPSQSSSYYPSGHSPTYVSSGYHNSHAPQTYRGGYYAGHNASQTRWSPYAQPHPSPSFPPPSYSRGGGYHKPSFRNKTLVVNSNSTDAANNPSDKSTPDTPGWVSKRDRGNMQLINTSVYDQKMQQKQLEMQESAKEKQRLRNDREKTKILRHVHGAPNPLLAPNASVPITTPKDVIINDLHFRVAADGSKLIRIFESLLKPADGSNKDAHTTPKQAKIAGVTFHRSKNGNLYRAGLVRKTMRYWKESEETGRKTLTLTYSKPKPNKSAKLCQKFTFTGVCPAGDRCYFTHDINKTAICQHFLRHGECAAGEECNLSHHLTPNRVPICIHFVRGNCTNKNCRYMHVRPNPTAPVCRPFGIMGYCEKGLDCQDRHVMECPDYSNTGSCRDANCRLPHVDSVANKRRAEAAKSANKGNAGSDDSSDLSSDEGDYEEIDSDDVDSDAVDEDIVMGGSGHELDQQQDFISFA